MASQIQNNCNNCGACAAVCPTKSIYSGDVHFLIDFDTCTDCLACLEVCPVDAIRNPKVKVERKKS
ncbi:MAG: DUF362 domain-containing protein [Bacteriovoracia bacterium]